MRSCQENLHIFIHDTLFQVLEVKPYFQSNDASFQQLQQLLWYLSCNYNKYLHKEKSFTEEKMKHAKAKQPQQSPKVNGHHWAKDKAKSSTKRKNPKPQQHLAITSETPPNNVDDILEDMPPKAAEQDDAVTTEIQPQRILQYPLKRVCILIIIVCFCRSEYMLLQCSVLQMKRGKQSVAWF